MTFTQPISSTFGSTALGGGASISLALRTLALVVRRSLLSSAALILR